jgi:hypothetical protein
MVDVSGLMMLNFHVPWFYISAEMKNNCSEYIIQNFFPTQSEKQYIKFHETA